jgi:4-amino-4-deoxy-L-arabinose transferase-like glycosyltransferase
MLNVLLLWPLFILNIWLINRGSGFTIPREMLFRGYANVWLPIISFPVIYLLLNFASQKLLEKYKFDHSKKNVIFVLSGCLLFAFSLFFTVQTNPDMGRYHFDAKYLVNNGLVDFFKNWGDFQTSFDMPTIPFLYGVSYLIFGEGKFAVLFINLLLFSGTLTFTYLTAKELFNRKVGLLSIIFFSISPFVLTQTPLMLVDLGETFFIVFSFYLILKLTNKPSFIKSITVSVILFITALTKIFSPIFLFPLALISFLLSHKKNNALKYLFFSWLVTLTFGIIYFYWKQELFFKEIFHYISISSILKTIIPLFTMALVLLATGFFLRKRITNLLVKNNSKVLGVTYALLFFLFLFGTKSRFYLRTPIIALTIPLAFLFFSSIYFAFKERNYHALMLLIWSFASLFIPNTMFKYQLPAYPAITMLSAFSLTEMFKSTKAQIKYVVTILAFSISIVFFFFLPMIQNHTKNNIRAAGNYINQYDPQKVVVLFFPIGEYGITYLKFIDENTKEPTPSLIHIMDFYTKGHLEYQTEEEFLNNIENDNIPDILVLTTHLHHDFSLSQNLQSVINEYYKEGPTFEKYSEAGIWRVKLQVFSRL